MIFYLDTSALLEWLFVENADINRPPAESLVCSELLRIETHRTFHRLRLQNKVGDVEFAKLEKSFRDFWESISVVFINAQILSAASRAFPTHIGTLDAIHLSTAILFSEKMKTMITMITNDRQLAVASQASGLNVVNHAMKSAEND